MKQACFLLLFLLAICACSQNSPTSTPSLTVNPGQSTGEIPATPILSVATILPETTPTKAIDPLTLSEIQRQRINFAALAYPTENEEQTWWVANSFQAENGAIDRMSGALAIAILQDARLLDSGTVPSDFLQGEDAKIEAALQSTFPTGQFNKFQLQPAVGANALAGFVLQVGDFLVLREQNGSITHMLVITRVDEQGRAYSVTTTLAQAGTLIEEVLVVDPAFTGDGCAVNSESSQTPLFDCSANGQIDVYRLQSADLLTVADEQQLAVQMLSEQIERALLDFGGDWNILIREDGGSTIYARSSTEKNHVASIIKIPMAILFFKYLENKGIQPEKLAAYFTSDSQGQYYYQLLQAMLVESDEAATDALGKKLDSSGLNLYSILNGWGITNTLLFKRFSTSEEIALMLEGLYRRDWIASEGREVLLTLMETYTPEDETRLGVMRAWLPEGAHLYNKRGTLTGERLVVGDAAILSLPWLGTEKVYYLVITGYPGNEETRYQTLEQAIQRVAYLFWNYVQYSQVVSND